MNRLILGIGVILSIFVINGQDEPRSQQQAKRFLASSALTTTTPKSCEDLTRPFLQSFRALNGNNEIQKEIINIISTAQKSIHIESGRISSSELTELLIEKLNRGVEVKLLVADPTEQLRGRLNRLQNVDHYEKLKQAGAKVYYYPKEQLRRHSDLPGLELHRKITIVDNEKAYLGTANIGSKRYENLDLGLLIDDVDEVRELGKIFNEDLLVSSRGMDYDLKLLSDFAKSKLTYLNGQGVHKFLLDEIERSQKEIILQSYQIDDPKLVRALIHKKKSNPNINIKVLIGPFSKRFKPAGIELQVPQNITQVDLLRNAGISVLTASDEMLVKKGYYHAKAAFFDQKKLLMGSTDFTQRGFRDNRELSVVIEEQSLVNTYYKYVSAEASIANNLRPFSTREKLISKLFESSFKIAEKKNKLKRLVAKIIPQNVIQMNLYYRKVKALIFNKLWGNSQTPSKLYRHAQNAFDEFHELSREYHFSIAQSDHASSLKENSRLVFAGYHTLGDLKKTHIGSRKTNKGFWGPGHYVTNNPRTAVEYGLMNAKKLQQNDTAIIHIYQITDLKLLNFNQHYDEYLQWLANNNKENLPAIIREYAQSNGYKGIIVPGAEGPGFDYYVIYDDEAIELYQKLTLTPTK